MTYKHPKDIVEIDNTYYQIIVSIFGTSILPLLIVIPVVYKFYRCLEKNSFLPSRVKTIFSRFFYFGFLPKFIADFLQTSSRDLIKKLVFDIPFSPQFSLFATQIASIFSFLYIYHFISLLKKISYYQHFDNQHLEYPYQEKACIAIQPELFAPSPHISSVEEAIIECIRIDAHDKLHIPKESIAIVALDEYHNRYFFTPEETILTRSLESNAFILSSFSKLPYLCYPEIDASYYFSYENNKEDFACMLDFLKQNNIFLIYPWKRNEVVSGAFIILNHVHIENNFISSSFIEKVHSYKHTLQSFYYHTFPQNTKEVTLFKNNTLEEHIKRLSSSQSEAVREIIGITLNIPVISFYSKKNKLYFSDEFFIEQLDQESFINELNNIVEDVDKKNISVEKKKIFVKNFLFSISCYPKNNHSNQINGTIITLPSIFPEYYHKSDFHTSKTFLSFTRMGKLLNSILPGNHPAVVRYKSEIINLILDPSPVIFPIESHHARFLTTIIGFIEGKKTKMVLSANEYEEIHQVFLKPDDEFCIGFFSVESTSHSLQKKIVDYCIEQNLKKNETSRSRIIVTVEELSDITQLYPLLVQICRFHNIQTPYVCHFSQEELLKIVRSYLSFSELNTNFFNFSMNTFLENIRDSWDLYELIDYIDSQITLEKLEGSLDNAIIEEKKALILKQAVSEGKNALKDNVLMFQLASICSSQSEIAHLLGVHRSSVSRFFKENNKKK